MLHISCFFKDTLKFLWLVSTFRDAGRLFQQTAPLYLKLVLNKSILGSGGTNLFERLNAFSGKSLAIMGGALPVITLCIITVLLYCNLNFNGKISAET